MDDFQVQCPYCFEIVELQLEHDVEGQFVQDCDVCCRPWQVRVSGSGGERNVQVLRG